MARTVKNTVTGIALIFLASGTAFADEARFDKSVANAAAEKAAGKIGEMRGMIDHATNPVIVTPESLEPPNKETNLLPRPAWEPLEKDSKLPPMVSRELDRIDRILTGSIKKPAVSAPQRLQWQRFDKDGRLISG